jgi:hypothetical protein
MRARAAERAVVASALAPFFEFILRGSSSSSTIDFAAQ